jgi:putative component of membrane protein insertase Oxa1/YidC/SpoIIIJ protein YidD
MGCLSGDEYTEVRGHYVKPHRRKKKSKWLSNLLKALIFVTDKILKLESRMLFINRLRLLNTISIKTLKIYQSMTVFEYHKCIYHPTCSNFAIMAYEKYMFLEATKRTISRLRDCKPNSNRNYINYP